MAFEIDGDIEKIIRALEVSQMPWVGTSIREYLSEGFEEVSDEPLAATVAGLPRRAYSREEQLEETIRLIERFMVFPFKMAGDSETILHELNGARREGREGRILFLDEDRNVAEPYRDADLERQAVERMYRLIESLRLALAQ